MDNALRPMQVSEITDLVKQVLESGFRNICIEGEISNFRPSSTGHWYFSLKDSKAMIQAAMFKNRIFGLKFKPEDGMLIRAYGSLSVYAQRGSYQIICERIELAGQGQILAMLEKRKQELAAEGLFDTALKKPLPLVPKKIAVITSPSGAALRDILQVLGRRNANIHVVILPAAVQGREAAEQISAQIRRANRYKLGEVIITGRGGGALEDLLPFSDEQVVRAVAASEIPVISAVGHEIDFALSDFAADVRAPTPSAAAELVSARRDELQRRIESFRSQLGWSMQERLTRIRQLTAQFRPENMEREIRIRLQPLLMRLDDQKESLINNMRQIIKQTRQRTETLYKELEAVSPAKVLERGYSIVSLQETGKVITRASEAEIGSMLNVTLAKGKLKTKVEEKL